MTPEVRPIDVVLGDLTPEQTARAEQLIHENSAFRAEVKQLRLAALAVADGSGAAPAPPALQLDLALAARPAWDGVRAPAGPRTRSTSTRWARVRAALTGPLSIRPAVAIVASLVLLVVGGVVDRALRGPGAPRRAPSVASTATRVGLAPFDGFAGGGHVSVQLPSSAGRQGVLVANALPPSGSGHYYELWLMTDGSHLASLGSFRVDARGHAVVHFSVAVDPHRYRYLDLSVQRDSGDPGHSSRSVLRSAPLA